MLKRRVFSDLCQLACNIHAPTQTAHPIVIDALLKTGASIPLMHAPSLYSLFPRSSGDLILMPLASKFRQVLLLLQIGVGAPLQTPLRYLNVHIDILNQTLFAHVVVFGSYKATDEQVHACAVEVLFELM